MRHRIHFACIVAAAAGFVALAPGEASARSHRPSACTLEYRPVCAVRNGVARVYPNACVAESQRARIVRKSVCSRNPVRVRG